jgi:hypothetical protein
MRDSDPHLKRAASGVSSVERSFYFIGADSTTPKARGVRALEGVAQRLEGVLYSIALTMSSTTFFASPNTIMVLSM